MRTYPDNEVIQRVVGDSRYEQTQKQNARRSAQKQSPPSYASRRFSGWGLALPVDSILHWFFLCGGTSEVFAVDQL